MPNYLPSIFLLFHALLVSSYVTSAQGKGTNQKSAMTNGYASVNGLKMYYEIHGSGDMPLVLIHGGGSTIETSFAALLPWLKNYYKIVAMDLQAHGRTSDRNAPESFEQDADDVAALLKELKIPKANFLGFSNGGTTALQLAIRHPSLVNKIVLVSAAYQREGFIEGFFDGMSTATIDNLPASLKQAFLKLTPDSAKLQTMFEKDRRRMIDFKDISDDAIKSITAPVLCMVSDKDVITVENTLKLSQTLPSSKLIVLPGFHGAFIGEIETAEKGSKMVEITAALVHEFLQ